MATGRVPTTANSPLTAKGDLFTYSTAPARLAVGNNGEQIVADSSASTGLRWQGDYAAGKNKIINGDFGIWQRGTSFSNPSTSTYTADRWRCYNATAGATITVSQQTFTPGTAPVAGYEGQYFFRAARTVTGTGSFIFNQRIEDVRTFAGQTVTFSFWAKANSAFTLTLNTYQYFGAGGSADVTANTSTVSITTSWTRHSITFAMPSISGKTVTTGTFLQTDFDMAANGVTLDVWGVQMEASNTATAFQTATGTLQGELAACQRYYYRLDSSGGAYGWTNAIGYAYNTSGIVIGLPLPVQMRVAPTSIDYSGMAVTNFATDTVIGSLTSISLNASRCTSNQLNVTIAKTSAFTAAATFTLNKSNNTADYIGASAEL